MQRISNRYDDVEYFLFAELLAANANDRLNIERPAPADGSLVTSEIEGRERRASSHATSVVTGHFDRHDTARDQRGIASFTGSGGGPGTRFAQD